MRWDRGQYPRMQCFNIQKSFQVIVHISKQKEKPHDCLDTEKAFSKIQHSLVIKCTGNRMELIQLDKEQL